MRNRRKYRDPRQSVVRRAIRTELQGDGIPDRPPNAVSTPAVRNPSVPVVQLDNVSLSFDRPILEDISFDARDGETICLVGESGTGKSTALKLILRLLIPERGRVLIDGDDI